MGIMAAAAPLSNQRMLPSTTAPRHSLNKGSFSHILVFPRRLEHKLKQEEVTTKRGAEERKIKENTVGQNHSVEDFLHPSGFLNATSQLAL